MLWLYNNQQWWWHHSQWWWRHSQWWCLWLNQPWDSKEECHPISKITIRIMMTTALKMFTDWISLDNHSESSALAVNKRPSQKLKKLDQTSSAASAVAYYLLDAAAFPPAWILATESSILAWTANKNSALQNQNERLNLNISSDTKIKSNLRPFRL